MKKSILNIVMAAFISCFAACSEEEIIATQDGTPKEVTVVAQVPNNATTRSVGVDNVIGNDQLRCILSVVKNDDKSEITRIEKLVNAEDTQISFTFTVGSNVEYSCLFWADYVDKSASKTGEKYTDKYYNTANMQAICVNADAENPANNAKLFNNPAADAFCGVLSNSQIKDADILNITLKRPFAKLNLTPKTEDDWKGKVGTMDIEFEMPGEFNMIAGSAAGTKTLVKATGVKKEAGKYFSTFLFVENPETAKFNSDIKIVLTEDNAETHLPEKVIEKGFTVKPNYEINGGVNLSTQEEIKVDVDIDGKPEDPNAPKVGQFLYADGTWGDAYNAEGSQESIGIIFAEAKGKTDNSEYGKEGMVPYAYAMALQNTGRKALNNDTEDANAVNFPVKTTITDDFSWNNEDYSGYAYTNTIITGLNEYTSPILTIFNSWKETNSITIENLSTWYIPSARQLLQITGMLYPGDNEINMHGVSVNQAFKTAYETVTTQNSHNSYKIDGGRNTTTNIMSSSLSNSVNTVQTTLQNNVISAVKTFNIKGSFDIRPVITILKTVN